jgi:hypothetical protein
MCGVCFAISQICNHPDLLERTTGQDADDYGAAVLRRAGPGGLEGVPDAAPCRVLQRGMGVQLCV